jgi:hypothetical protein
MLRWTNLSLVILTTCCAAVLTADASQLVESKIETKLLPAPVEFNVLLPDGYETLREPVPLLLFLHGGGGDRSFLTRMRAVIDDMWRAGTLPKMVVVTPSAGRSFYMDYKNGAQKWESFIVGPFWSICGRLTKSHASEKERCCLASRWAGLAVLDSLSSIPIGLKPWPPWNLALTPL